MPDPAFYCPLDGKPLEETGLGLYVCRECDTQFIPSSREGYEKDHPGQQMMSLSWVREGS